MDYIKIETNESTRANRRPWAWTGRNEERARDVLKVVSDLRPYWPLTIRQVYYRLISTGVRDQNHWLWNGKKIDIYNALVPLMKWMRIDDRISWNAIHDEHRSVSYFPRFENPSQFVTEEVDSLFAGYSRCLAQGQPRHIEIWIEKNALRHIIEPVSKKYCRRLIVCRGYDSISFQTDFYQRAAEALNRGQIPTILYLGDWDPSGENMPYAASQTLHDEFGLVGIEHYRIGINPEHFDSLQADPIPIKATDSRSKKFVKKHGITAYELDAFHPSQLRELAEKAIRDFTDMDELERQAILDGIDKKRIDDLRERVIDYIDSEVENF